MKKEIINEIEQKMSSILNNEQKKLLNEVLIYAFFNIEIVEKKDKEENNVDYAELFVSAKRIEGCSDRTINYYKTTIENMIEKISKKVNQITTEDLRNYLSEYQIKNNCSKVTLDNVRRILSSFFSWLEDEDYIVKSPVRRIHKIKPMQIVKETYSDEELEKMRDSCTEIRDLAMIDFLISTGVRVGELVNLKKTDINIQDRSCVVLGKGGKQREVYFDARTKVHLLKYFATRKDKNEIEESLKNVYKRFPRLEERKNQMAGTLSGGEQQMLAMGRALMSKPKIILMDEPSMGLSPIMVNEIFDIIRSVSESGTTVLLVEQNAKKALSIADRAYVLETGKIVLEGKAKDLLEDDSIKKAYLGE